MPENKKVVLSLSGGMDSTTLLGYYLEKEYSVHIVNFNYCSKHNKFEAEAVEKIYEFYAPLYRRKQDIEIESIFLSGFDFFKSASLSSLKNTDPIPEGHYNDETMRQTVVPGRNTIFLAYLMGIAESNNISNVAIGVHQGDHHIYPDCRPQYILAMQKVFNEATEGKVNLLTPFLHFKKKDILQIGYSLQIPPPYHLTRTCYKDQPLSCGKCGACLERLEAFELIGKADPIRYE